ncbi:MAG: glycoside hydrolase family 2 TIM barrel-domain containing protein [Sphaerochaetaceae bacterium]|nr:glycoside hydrolase family 2 TIM barrel-domain containing protein [Sphaerochaetaceae bacterium]
MSKIENFNKDIHTLNYKEKYENVRVTSNDLIKIESREVESLNGLFHFSVDPYETCLRASWYQEKKIADNGLKLPIDSDFEYWDEINVPSCWNTEIKDLYLYENMGLYFKQFDYLKKGKERVFLHFEAVMYRAYVFLNGEPVAMHDGGSTPFSIEITNYIKENNRLIIACDASRSDDRVPMSNTDWFNYGGIYRDIMLVRTPKTFIKDWSSYLVNDTNFSKIAFNLSLDKEVDGFCTFEIKELGIKKEIKIVNGKASDILEAKPILWDTDNPKLYDVSVTYKSDTLFEKIGFREIKVDGLDVKLNGKSIYLKGVSVHEDHIDLGKTTNEEIIRNTIKDLKQMNGNFLRLAHYPHTRLFSKLADELGVLLWEEIPVYWAINFDSKMTYLDAENQLSELILRDRNRASVIIWSVGNENPDTDSRLEFMSKLVDKAKSLDPSRLVSAACLVNTTKLKLEDRLMDKLDIIGNNEYYGWYEPRFEDLLTIFENTELDKPVIITEFGAGAKANNHSTKDTMWSEEYQQDIYKKQFQTISKSKYIKGTTPWIFYDFRAVRRLNRYQKGFNRKGLIDSDRKTKKLAFYVTQEHYSKIK